MDTISTNELTASDLRKFAFTTGGIVAVLFGLLLPWIWEFNYPRWPWIFLGVFGLWGLIAPRSLGPVYRGWMRVGHLISKVTTPLIMGAVFFVIIMPVGVLVRIFGWDPLHRKFDASATSYRVDKKGEAQGKLENPY